MIWKLIFYGFFLALQIGFMNVWMVLENRKVSSWLGWIGRRRTAVNVVTSHVIVLHYEFKDVYDALVMRNRNLAVTDNDIRFGQSLVIEEDNVGMGFNSNSCSEATVDAVTDIGEQLICSVAFGELMRFTVILHPMGRGCINAYVLAPLN
ncbi:hypothetical protein FQA39_LY16889 [Lamprigera yunnana]|nr:hypothetical protein FQA39_LY16889 [Lamprigera yunnana]